MKTFEEILKETIEDDFRTQHVTTESPENRAAKAYAEQFIDAAAEEASYFQSPNSMKKKILKLKEHLK
jgi:hypothetical protein